MTAPLLFFPEKPDWDVQAMRVAAQALYGGADVFECLEVARAIHADGADEEAWRGHWSGAAERLVDGGGSAGATTLAQNAARACSYFRTAEFFAPFRSAERKKLYDASRNAFRQSIPQLPVDVDVIAVPDGDVEYDGYVFRGRGATEDAPGPGVVFLGGADSYAEELFFFGGCAIAERGITVIVADTPGRGSTLRHKGVVTRPDYEKPAGKLVDHLAGLPYVDADRIGAVGLSLGGYYAPRLAALDDRIKALVCWCACYDVVEDIYEFCEPIRAQLRWIVGAESDEDAREALAPFNLRDVAPQITCPTLISHGVADTIIAVAGAEHLHDAIGAEEKVLRIWSEEEGGADHCNYDAWGRCVPFMFDWLAERL